MNNLEVIEFIMTGMESNDEFTRDKGHKYYIFLSFLIGLGFFSVSITWILFNTFVPLLLADLMEIPVEKTVIGFIMTIDNILAISLQPWIGARSDNTWNKFGRRMPYILVGLPLSAIIFIFIPWAAFLDLGTWTFVMNSTASFVAWSAFLLLWIILIFDLSMALYRSPIVALMPDLIPSKYRSTANGVINLMGGVGAAIGLIIGNKLYATSPLLTFVSASILMLLALALLKLTIKEPSPEALAKREALYAGDKKDLFDIRKERMTLMKAFNEVFSDTDKSGLFILLAIFSWFIAYYTIETWGSTYGVEILGMADEETPTLLFNFVAAFILFALPAGFVSLKLGRKNTIILGLTGLIIVFLIVSFTLDVELIKIYLGVGGIFWALININSITIVWDIASEHKLGAYTGLYYFFSQLAAILGPIIAGALFDIFTIRYMFHFTTLFLILALIVMIPIKKGEAKTLAK